MFAAIIKFHRNISKLSLLIHGFPPPCAPFLLVSSSWAKKLGSPAHAANGSAAGGAGSSFPTVPTNSTGAAGAAGTTGAAGAAGAADAAGAAGSGFSWHRSLRFRSHSLGEKNMVLGHFPTNREGKDARVVNVSLLFVGVSEHAGCFSGCSS